MNFEDFIDITKADLIEVVKAAYDLSNPVGMGILHYTEEPLSDEEAKQLIDEGSRGKFSPCVSMDYVKGRCCKFSVWHIDGKLYIRKDWYDHTKADVDKLLEMVGLNEC